MRETSDVPSVTLNFAIGATYRGDVSSLQLGPNGRVVAVAERTLSECIDAACNMHDDMASDCENPDQDHRFAVQDWPVFPISRGVWDNPDADMLDEEEQPAVWRGCLVLRSELDRLRAGEKWNDGGIEVPANHFDGQGWDELSAAKAVAS